MCAKFQYYLTEFRKFLRMGKGVDSEKKLR